jgi:hypothetical protein
MTTHSFIILAIISAIFAPAADRTTSPAAKTSSAQMAVSGEEPPSTKSASLVKKKNEQSADEKQHILWLARIIHSETHVESEMPLIGWVVRNRVETGFRGTTYKEVALSKNQFSGLNPADPHYARNISVGYENANDRVWQQALAAAEKVYYADASDRPFPKTVRHFYSPVAIAPPTWAKEEKLYHAVGGSLLGEEAARFAFYSNVE